MRFNRLRAIVGHEFKEEDDLVSFKSRHLRLAADWKASLPNDYTMDRLMSDLTIIGLIRNLPAKYEVLRQNVLLKEKADINEISTLFDSLASQFEYDEPKVESAFKISNGRTDRRSAYPTSSAPSSSSATKACPIHPNVNNHNLIDCFLWKAFQEWNKETHLAQEFATRAGRSISKPSRGNSSSSRFNSHSAGNNNRSGANANMIGEVPEDHVANLAASTSAFPSTVLPTAHTTLCADTGCSSTMTPHKAWFVTYTPVSQKVYVADGKAIDVVGKGEVVFQPVVNGALL